MYKPGGGSYTSAHSVFTICVEFCSCIAFSEREDVFLVSVQHTEH